MSHDESIAHLRAVDPKLARVIDRIGPCRFETRTDGTPFDALTRAIIYQQLSGKAAGTIHARVHAQFGGRAPTPAEILATPDEQLRAAGLSRQKLSYLKDLAAKTESRLIPQDDTEVVLLTDEEIIKRLVQVKGIGRWTVQMFLIFRLGRPDVLPELDLGVQSGLRRAYGLRKHPKPADVLRIGKKWSPHSTIASWYLWRFVEAERSSPAKTAKRGAKKRAKAVRNTGSASPVKRAKKVATAKRARRRPTKRRSARSRNR
jgi:DNA-3-methyladenine glycosylase II